MSPHDRRRALMLSVLAVATRAGRGRLLSAAGAVACLAAVGVAVHTWGAPDQPVTTPYTPAVQSAGSTAAATAAGQATMGLVLGVMSSFPPIPPPVMRVPPIPLGNAPSRSRPSLHAGPGGALTAAPLPAPVVITGPLLPAPPPATPPSAPPSSSTQLAPPPPP